MPFVPIVPGRELEGSYNQRTLDRFKRFVRVRSEQARGKPIRADTIDGYASAIKVFRERQAGQRITSQAVNVRGPLLTRGDRREEAPRGHRAKCVGVGGADFDAIAQHCDRSSRAGCQDFAVGHLAYACLLRGGEVGTTEGGFFDCSRDLTIASIVPRDGCVASRGRLWLEAWVCAIKDVEATRRPVPIPVCRRADGPRTCADPRDSYDAIMSWVELRRREVPREQWHLTPLFVRPDGRWWETDDVRTMVRPGVVYTSDAGHE